MKKTVFFFLVLEICYVRDAQVSCVTAVLLLSRAHPRGAKSPEHAGLAPAAQQPADRCELSSETHLVLPELRNCACF